MEKTQEQKANFKSFALRVSNQARYNAPFMVAGALGAGSLASAEEFTFDYTGVAGKVTAAILGAAAAGATVRALGIGIKASFRWASSLIK